MLNPWATFARMPVNWRMLDLNSFALDDKRVKATETTFNPINTLYECVVLD